MRRAHRLALALAGVLLISAPATRAADGIKAAATASREVPADILVVSFQLTERIVPGDPAPATADQRGMLAKALEGNGLEVLSRSARYMPNTGVYGAHQSVSSAGTAREPIDVRKLVTFRVTGFKRIDDVLDVLGRHGVRQNLSLSADHSRAEAVREELRKEAIESAIAQARQLAARAGVKTGGVVDLATQPPGFAAAWSVPHYPTVVGVDQSLIDARQPGELPRLRFTVTANVVLAIKPE
jgi:uncharacterized protein YggE